MHEASSARQRWLARVCLLSAAVAALVLLGYATSDRFMLVLIVAAGLAVMVAAAFWFLTHRGLLRWLALALGVADVVVVTVLFLTTGHLGGVLVVAALVLLALVTGWSALAEDATTNPAMPEHGAPPPRRPFLIMNPRSGGGKVDRFDLVARARSLGAEVALLEGPGEVDVAALARQAVADGADLLGVAGGDGTQALVAGVAAEYDVPFLVLAAGTRNHFALDLGLDRDDPAAGLDALTEDAVELHVDLGDVGGRTFVNNASFGAYAEVVQDPAYRADKTRTTLELLPDLLSGHAGPHLVAQTGQVLVDHPQAVLVSDNPYGMGDLAGMGRRARLDTGVLGVVTVSAETARDAVGMLRHATERGVLAVRTSEVVVTADAERIPVGVDGEAVVLDTPVRCRIRPRALRVRVPRDRPGVPTPRPAWSWVRLRTLALGRGSRR